MNSAPLPLPLLAMACLATASAQTVFWDHKAKGQLLYTCGETEGRASNNQLWRQSGFTSTAFCNRDFTVLDVSNWSTQTFPNSTTVDVVLAGSTPQTILGNDISVSTITIAATNELDIRGNGRLRPFGGRIHNDGLLSLNNPTGSFSNLIIHADTTLSGTGTLRFESNGNNLVLSDNPAFVLTIGPGQTVLATPAAVASASSGNSRFTAAFVNEGLISADSGGLVIETHPKVNRATIEAINNGTLALRNVSIDNTGGVIAPRSPGATVDLRAATLTGGRLEGNGQYTITANQNSRFDGPITIAPETKVVVDSFDTLFVTGTITNEGTVRVQGVSGNSADLEIIGNTTFAGGGQILLEGPSFTEITSDAPQDILTLSANQSIRTAANTVAENTRITAALTNDGVITANGGGLRIDTNPKTNNGIIEAVGGAEIILSAVTIDNEAGMIRADAGSSYKLRNATINGGQLHGPGGYELILNSAVSTLGGGLTVGADTSVSVDGFKSLILDGTITNQGTLRLSATSFNPARLRIKGDTTVSGTGQILFDGDEAAWIESTTAADILTVGAGQTITTSADTTLSTSRIIAAVINNGIIDAKGGGLLLDTNPKTNNGTFRASAGGTLEVRNAGTLLTNFSDGTLTGGRYEAFGTGSTLDLDGADISEIAAGTSVVISGTGASIPSLGSLEILGGTLALRNGVSVSIDQSLQINGILEIGLPPGAGGGFATTSLVVDGDLDLVGATINISDLGATDGTYQIATASGSLTGTPTIGRLPSRLGASVEVTGNTLTVTVFTAPKVFGLERNAQTGEVSIRYQSIAGQTFAVEGGSSLTTFGDVRPSTAVGTGGMMEYTDTPPVGAGTSYFYRLIRGR